MRVAYALLGLAFIIVLIAAYVLVQRAEAPTRTPPEIEATIDT